MRAARAVAASTAATLVALASHLAAGGAAPPLLLVAAVCALSWLPAIPLIGRRPSIVRQGLVIALSECALHATFALGAAAPPSIGPARPAGDLMAAMPGMMPSGGAGPLPSMPAASPAMWGAHVVAGLLTVLAWNRGEAAVWAIVRFAQELPRVVLPDLPTAATPVEGAVTPPQPDLLPSFHLERVLAARARRGPPVPSPQF